MCNCSAEVSRRLLQSAGSSEPRRLQLTAAVVLPTGSARCYRWYEAAASGSTPIVEDIIKPASCGRDPLALLKVRNAPPPSPPPRTHVGTLYPLTSCFVATDFPSHLSIHAPPGA